MWSDERRKEELSALNIVALVMLFISLPWDIFVYKTQTDTIFWLMKTILFILPYLVWWGTYRLGLGHWTQTSVVLSYMCFCYWHTVWIHTAYYIAFIETLVLSLLFWRPPNIQFYIQLIVATSGMGTALYFANEFPYTMPGKTARLGVGVDSIIFMLNIAAYHWYVGRVQEKRRQRELNFADLGMRSSFLVHELHRPLHRISQNIDEPNNHEAIAELRSIVDALDGVTHGRELEVSEVDVNEVFMSLRRQYAQYLADFGVRFDLSGELNLNVHVGAFKLVMKNLFLNALEEAAKLPPPRRWVVVTLGPDKKMTISNPVAEPKRLKRQDIFSPGFTTKRGHQGMGLALSNQIAKACGIILSSKVQGDQIVFNVNARV